MHRHFCLLLVCLCVATTAAAQTSGDVEVTPIFRDVTRVDAWSFFEPRADTVDPTYTLLGNRATLGVRVNSRKIDVQGAFQYAQLIGLPRRSVGPGPLGPGPLFFDAARNSRAYQLYFKTLSLRVRDIAPGLSIEVGRMPYTFGNGRLIGEAEWTMSERAFDGIRFDFNRGGWQGHASFVMPTQGAFEESANPTMGKVRVATTAMTTPHAIQIFAHHYRDQRPIRSRPDNTGLPTAAADISIATVGVSHDAIYAVGPGHVDTSIWFAQQFGDWYDDRHTAASVIAEAGYQFAAGWRPWFRAGYRFASGDDSPADYNHGTFFPMVPTTRPDVLAGTYAQMNLRDAFAEVRLSPRDRLDVTGEIHSLTLDNRMDRWYSGTGATAIRGNYFGYAGRLSSLATDLGTLAQLSVGYRATNRWSLRGTIARVNGGEVVRRLFAGSTLTVLSFESRFMLQ